jgi:hypothetical protein
MSQSRAEFSQSVKDSVAGRVGWRCSFPNCHIPTIGPSQDDPAKTINLGEAAHIYAASPNGPRANPDMDDTQRSSIENAIWLCRQHARLIDRDPELYSAETLLSFKLSAEKSAHEQLRDMQGNDQGINDTYIALTNEILFKGAWMLADENIWTFKVGNFVQGNIHRLQQISISYDEVLYWDKFIAIESQGYGRALEKLSWRLNEKNQHEIICQVGPKAPRRDPNKFGGDLLFDPITRDLVMKDGDFVMVTGKDSALQSLQLLLASQVGDWIEFPHVASHFSQYCNQFSTQPDILNHLIKTEIIRLMTVVFQTKKDEPSPELSFIDRVIHVDVREINVDKKIARLYLELEFGNFEHWKGELPVNIR